MRKFWNAKFLATLWLTDCVKFTYMVWWRCTSLWYTPHGQLPDPLDAWRSSPLQWPSHISHPANAATLKSIHSVLGQFKQLDYFPKVPLTTVRLQGDSGYSRARDLFLLRTHSFPVITHYPQPRTELPPEARGNTFPHQLRLEKNTYSIIALLKDLMSQ